MSSVTLKQLVKEYDGLKAVKGLDLTVPQGQLFALLGPSGCGKTTTLRMIAGFIPVTSGTILFGSNDVTTLQPHQRNCGMVFQSYALFPHMDVFHNVGYGLEMRKVSAPEIKTRVMDALERVQLTSFATRFPRQLSGGQQQRVALARAIVIRPDVLLLDEPLSNLDAKLRHLVRNEIRQLQQEFGLTTIFVTHDQEEALSIADKLVIMNGGVIEQEGTPSDLYDRPASRFVADFIGRSNFLEGVASEGVFTTIDGVKLAIDREHPDGHPPKIALAIKPESIKIAERSTTNGPNNLAGQVEFVNFIGPFTEYHVRCGANRFVVHASRIGREHARTYQPGDPVTISWPVEASRLVADRS